MFVSTRSFNNYFLYVSSFVSSFRSTRVSSFFNVGFMLSIILVLQLFTGVVWYCFLHCSDSYWLTIDCSLRSVYFLWYVRSIHFWCAGFFFFFVYVHMFRSFVYRVGSFVTWLVGVLIFLILCIVGFTGYVLPNASMSFWAWTVITSFVTAFPYGDEILYLLWGGLFSDVFTLSRVATLHFLLPFVIAFLVLLHLVTLHDYGSVSVVYNSVSSKDNFTPYLLFKDFFFVVVYFFVLFFCLTFFWFFLKHSDDFDVASSLKTPESILPEIYYLAFYGMLRSTESKLFGLIDVILFFVWIFTSLFFFDSFFFIPALDSYWLCSVLMFIYFFVFIKYLTILHLSEINLFLLLFCNMFMCFMFSKFVY